MIIGFDVVLPNVVTAFPTCDIAGVNHEDGQQQFNFVLSRCVFDLQSILLEFCLDASNTFVNIVLLAGNVPGS